MEFEKAPAGDSGAQICSTSALRGLADVYQLGVNRSSHSNYHEDDCREDDSAFDRWRRTEGATKSRRGTLVAVLCGALLLGTLRSAGSSAEQGTTPPLPPTAEETIVAYNNRLLGSPGWRRVAVELITDGRVTNKFTVLQVWLQGEDSIRSIFYLEEPPALRGTSYLQIERVDGSHELEVYLYIPAGERRVLSIAASEMDEGLLGSDFTYNDLRWLLPRGCCRYSVLGLQQVLGQPTVVLEAHRVDRAPIGVWQIAHFFVQPDLSMILAADYYASSEGVQRGNPDRRMRVQHLTPLGRVWTEVSKTMRSAENRRTRIELIDAELDLDAIDERIFTPEALSRLEDSDLLRGIGPHLP